MQNLCSSFVSGVHVLVLSMCQVSRKSDLRIHLQALVSSGVPDLSTSVLDENTVNLYSLEDISGTAGFFCNSQLVFIDSQCLVKCFDAFSQEFSRYLCE